MSRGRPKKEKPDNSALANELINATTEQDEATPLPERAENPQESEGEANSENPQEKPKKIDESADNPPLYENADTEKPEGISEKDWQDYKASKAAANAAMANAPKPPTEKTEDELHEERVKRFGLNYVVADKGNLKGVVFTARAWERLGGVNNTDGWIEQIKTPPEVKGLENK